MVHTLRAGPADPSRRAPGPSLVLAASAYNRIVTVSVPGGRPRTVLALGPKGDSRELVRSPSWASDGRSFVVSVGNPEFPGPRLVILQLASRRRTEVSGKLFRAPDSIAFSPDDRYLLVPGGRDRTEGLYAYDVRRRRAVWLLQGPVNAGSNLSWSSDGRRIAFAIGSRAGGIGVFDAAAGTVKLLTGDGTDPAWSPDGTHVAFVSHRGGEGRSCGELGCSPNGEIDVIRADGGDRRRLTHTASGELNPSWSPDGSRIVAQATTDERMRPSGLVTLHADGSCYRTLAPPTAVDDFQLGSGAWRPVSGPAPSEPGC